MNLIIRTENGIINNTILLGSKKEMYNEFNKKLEDHKDNDCFYNPDSRNYFSYIDRWGIPIVYNLLINIGEEE